MSTPPPMRPRFEKIVALPPAQVLGQLRKAMDRSDAVCCGTTMPGHAVLRLPDDQAMFEPETVTIEPVVTADGTPWSKSADAEVLVLGDSFVEGVHVPTDALFHRRLGAALDRPDRPVEAISLSRSGWGQAEELAQLRDVGVRYAPDLVLVEFLPLNDVRDNWPELEHLAEGEIARASWARPLEHDVIETDVRVLVRVALRADEQRHPASE